MAQRSDIKDEKGIWVRQLRQRKVGGVGTSGSKEVRSSMRSCSVHCVSPQKCGEAIPGNQQPPDVWGSKH